jgi:single-strand DNA-binding protein
MNKVFLLGRITNNLELKGTDKKYTKFFLAVRRNEKETDFISCISWNKTAEFITKYMKKGSQICISGRIQTGQYDDKDGKRIYTADVIVEEVDFAESKKEEKVEDLGTKQFEQALVNDDLPF